MRGVLFRCIRTSVNQRPPSPVWISEERRRIIRRLPRGVGRQDNTAKLRRAAEPHQLLALLHSSGKQQHRRAKRESGYW